MRIRPIVRAVFPLGLAVALICMHSQVTEVLRVAVAFGEQAGVEGVVYLTLAMYLAVASLWLMVCILSPTFWAALSTLTPRRYQVPEAGSGNALSKALRGPAERETAPLGLGRCAYHEAAHAVVGLALGGRVESIDVQCVGVRGGMTVVSFKSENVDAYWRNMAVCLAGNCFDLQDGHQDSASAADIEGALTYAAAAISTGQSPSQHDGPLTFDALFASASAAARVILAKNRHTLDLIVNRLENTQRRGCLTGEDLADLPVTPYQGTQGHSKGLHALDEALQQPLSLTATFTATSATGSAPAPVRIPDVRLDGLSRARILLAIEGAFNALPDRPEGDVSVSLGDADADGAPAVQVRVGDTLIASGRLESSVS